MGLKGNGEPGEYASMNDDGCKTRTPAMPAFLDRIIDRAERVNKSEGRMRAYIKDEEEEEEESSERRFERLFSEVTSRKSPEAPSRLGDEHPEADVGKEESVMSRVQGCADERGAESLERSPPLGVDPASRKKKKKIPKLG